MQDRQQWLGEEWKPIFDGHYSVSNLGRVRRNTGRTAGRIKQPSPNCYGYYTVSISLNGSKTKTVPVHKLVALAFIGPRPKGKQVNHKSGIKTDNRPSNLEYVTSGENTRHAHALGLVAPMRGERHGQAILCEHDVREIRARRSHGERGIDIARLFGITPQAVCDIVKGRNWSHVA